MERTFVILKPDTVKRGLIGEIINRIEKRDIKIVAMKMEVLSMKDLDTHYEHVKKYPIFDEMMEFMISGPSVLMILEKENVIGMMRTMQGSTFCHNSPTGTIRGDFGHHQYMNLIHASDSHENAEIEIKRFFSHEI